VNANGATMSKSLYKNLKRAGNRTTMSIELLEKAAVLGTARMLRKVLDNAQCNQGEYYGS